MEHNLIDLVSDMHLELRKETDRCWADEKGDGITRAEGHLLHRLYRQELSISSVARKMDMSRQAVHKCAAELLGKGYLIQKPGANKRDKVLILTDSGETYCRENLALKQRLEEKIALQIGMDNVILLKELLQKPWLSKA